ncbi:MAG: CoB--CoM heterodisulfide reductase iron-sulfur subunit B family protein [Proteobacteria bacterium]|nr:CoB--CoM heterodisulfide reductase iron-sulfur subunit B family protein [Pseudomonadota bacterium]
MKFAFYPGCSYEGTAGYPESVSAVSRALGLELEEVPDWNCCGATAYFSLDKYQALALTARVFALARARGHETVLTVCNACYTTLRKGYETLTSDPGLLARINEALKSEGLAMDDTVQVRHMLEVLTEVLPPSIWSEKAVRPMPAWLGSSKVAGYYGCQLTRPWGDLDRPERPDMLERFITALGLIPARHSAGTMCCGASHSAVYSRACRPLVERIVRGVRRAEAGLIATICPLCQFNLDAGQIDLPAPHLPVLFFTQLAGLALGLAPEELGLNKLMISLNFTG